MHSAPAVSYPVGRSSIRLAMLGLPLLAAGVVVLVWAAQPGPAGWPQALAATLWLAAAGATLAEHRRACRGVLRWDGQQWQWLCPGREHAGTVAVRLDWQGGLLLEFCAQDGSRHWLWPQRRSAPLYWDALRRALYAPQGVAPDGATTVPGAVP